MKNTISTSSLLIIALVATQALAWHGLGHMSVAAIAEFHLKKSNMGTEAWQWATDLLTPFSDYCGEENHPFVESATWPDKIKEQGWMTMFKWHFINQKLAAPGFVIPEDNTKDQDIVWAINKASSFIAGTKVDFSGHSKTILGKSLELRNLIHWLGDVHQPLHSVQRYSE